MVGFLCTTILLLKKLARKGVLPCSWTDKDAAIKREPKEAGLDSLPLTDYSFLKDSMMLKSWLEVNEK